MEVHKLEEKKSDGLTKKHKADLSDTGIVNDTGAAGISDQQEDSFQKMYSKELDLDEDEVPIILHELNDSAIHFISRDSYDRALSLLQKAQTLIDRLQFQKNPNDRLMVFLTMHNMALCFQKLGALEECALCIEASLQTLNSPFLLPKFSGDPAKKLKRLKYECKAHMQVCALLSQLHRHKDALIHAEKSVQIAQYMIADLLGMCQYYQQKVIVAKKNEQIAQELIQNENININGTAGAGDTSPGGGMKDLIYYDDSISMLERTAYRILPIIQDCFSRMIKSPDNINDEELKRIESQLFMNEFVKPKINMKAVLGYLNQSEWLYLLNIGNIMQITPLTVHDLYSNTTFEVELTRDSILEKVKDDPSIDPMRKKKESEFWHAKALEISVSYLPSECPLVTHILTSYQKHHAPVSQEIPEDEEHAMSLKVIRPQPGIDISKFQPMVRQDSSLNITLPPLPLSPNNYGINKEKQYMPQSLPFSPNGYATQVSQYNVSSQFQKLTDTTSSQNNLTGVGGTSVQNTIRQQQREQQRFHSNKNNVQQPQSTIGGGAVGRLQQPPGNLQKQHYKGSINNKQQQQQLLEQQQQYNDSFVDVEGTVLEDGEIIDEEDLMPSTTGYGGGDPQNNKSMMEVVPSQNYKKLLHDFSNLQNSSDIMEDDGENQQYFDVNETNGHQESQEVDLLYERRTANNGKNNARKNQPRKRIPKNNQILDISQDILEDEEDQDMFNHYGDEEDEEDEPDDENDTSIQDDRSFHVNRTKHNLSVDGGKIKRPKTSQGFRRANNRTGQGHIDKKDQFMNNISVRIADTHNNHISREMKNSSNGLQQLNSVDRKSPMGRVQQRHNQSMGTTHAGGKQSKLNNNLISTNGMQINTLTNIPPSGAITDLKGNSTPIKSNSMAVTGYNFKNRGDNMNLSRANLERVGDVQKTNQSSTSELGLYQKRPGSKGKSKRNPEIQQNSVVKRNQYQQQQISQASLRSQSQQKQMKYPTQTTQQSAGKTKYATQDSSQQSLSNLQNPHKSLPSNEGRKTMNEVFMVDRIKKRAPTGALNTQEQPSKSFEISQSDPKYRSQHFGSQSRSKNRSKAQSSRSKEKQKNKSGDQNQQNLEELKRQILLKQSLIESNKNTRRKSAGASNSQNATQQQQTKKIENFQRIFNAQQLLQTQQNNSQQWAQNVQIMNNLPKQQKQHTHQLIKKFLKERQTNQSMNSVLQFNNSMIENYVGTQQLTTDQQINNYKTQLSKKILQQQQKLIMGQQVQPSQFYNDTQQYITETHPINQRSATPMIELNGINKKNQQYQTTKGMNITGVQMKQDKSLVDIGNVQNKQQNTGNVQSMLKEYMSVQDFNNQSLREDSIGKSLKKKNSKKATPKNILANSQFAWI